MVTIHSLVSLLMWCQTSLWVLKMFGLRSYYLHIWHRCCPKVGLGCYVVLVFAIVCPCSLCQTPFPGRFKPKREKETHSRPTYQVFTQLPWSLLRAEFHVLMIVGGVCEKARNVETTHLLPAKVICTSGWQRLTQASWLFSIKEENYWLIRVDYEVPRVLRKSL